MTKRKLTNKQARFVEEYLKDLNATQAAIRAGYSKKTANEIGCVTLAKVSEEVAAAQAERSRRTQIDSDYVLKNLVKTYEMDTLDILNEDGSIKPITEWPKIWRQNISGMDVSQRMIDGDGDNVISVLLKKIKWIDKLKTIELIGRHVNVQAFKDQVGHSGELSVSVKDMFDRISGNVKGVKDGS